MPSVQDPAQVVHGKNALQDGILGVGVQVRAHSVQVDFRRPGGQNPPLAHASCTLARKEKGTENPRPLGATPRGGHDHREVKNALPREEGE